MNDIIRRQISARPLGVIAIAIFFSAASAASSKADVITQWNFNLNALGTQNNPVPSIGSGVASMVGMTNNALDGNFQNASNGIGSSDPAVSPNDFSWRVRGSVNNGWSGTTSLLSGAQFMASTVGYSDIVVSFNLNATDGSPRHAQLQVTTDGTTFSSFGSLLDFNPTNDNWANGITYDFSLLPGASNNPNFGFKVVSAFTPFDFTDAGGFHAANTAFQRADADPSEGPYTGGAGNYRFDMVTFSGTPVPEPSTVLLIGMAAVGGLLPSRRRARS